MHRRTTYTHKPSPSPPRIHFFDSLYLSLSLSSENPPIRKRYNSSGGGTRRRLQRHGDGTQPSHQRRNADAQRTRGARGLGGGAARGSRGPALSRLVAVSVAVGRRSRVGGRRARSAGAGRAAGGLAGASGGSGRGCRGRHFRRCIVCVSRLAFFTFSLSLFCIQDGAAGA